MSAIDGFRLELPDGTVHRVAEPVKIVHRTEPVYSLAWVREYLETSEGALPPADRLHIITVRFTDSVPAQIDELHGAAPEAIDAPTLLEFGEHNDPANHPGIESSRFDPIPVVMGDSGPPDAFDGELTFIDVSDHLAEAHQ